MDLTQLRAEHDRVLESISCRRSVVHIARAGVVGFVAFMGLCLAGVLWWDFSEYYPERWKVALACVAPLVVVVLLELARGNRLLRQEHAALARLKALRSQLQLDSPETYLPRA